MSLVLSICLPYENICLTLLENPEIKPGARNNNIIFQFQYDLIYVVSGVYFEVLRISGIV